jgi:hypothetical protein
VAEGGAMAKLIEVLDGHLGKLLAGRYRKIQRKADQEDLTESLRLLREQGITPDEVKLEGGQGTKFSLVAKQDDVSLTLVEMRAEPERYAELPAARALERMLLEEGRSQRNIESVSEQALLAAIDTTDPVDPDTLPSETWLNHFFDYARFVSDEEVQSIWGKVLAGEVQNPGHFSLRTLDVLRNLSKHEAQLFQRVARFRIYNIGFGPYILNSNDDKASTIKLPSDLSYADQILLVNAGLINVDIMTVISYGQITSGGNVTAIHGSRVIVGERPDGDAQRKSRVYCFTQEGTELCNLIPMETNKEVIDSVIKTFKGFGWSVWSADVESWDHNKASYDSESRIDH